MSTKKKNTVDEWDKNEGRFTLYFDQSELDLLKKAVELEGLGGGAELIKAIVRKYLAGLLVKKEAVDAYKEVLETVVKAVRPNVSISRFGTKGKDDSAV